MTRWSWRPILGACLLSMASLGAADQGLAGQRLFYLRQTLGDDGNDGRSPATAWRSLSKLDKALEAGDTAYVGPGLYRDAVFLRNSGTEEAPIRILGDPSGRHTGDPPGVVLIAGADPVDESVFDEALELARELVRSIRQGEDLLATPPTASASTSD